MTLRSAFPIVLALLLLAGCSSPDEPPRQVRAVIQAALDEARQEMGPAAPTKAPPGMVRPVNVSQDGVTDWLIDYEKGGFAGWCGTGGCQTKILVSRPGGKLITAFDRTAIKVDFGEAGGEHIIDVWLHGTLCDGAGADDCRRRFAWNPVAGRFDERPNLKGSTRLEVLFPTVDPDPVEIPQAARIAVSEAARRCMAAGAKMNEIGPQIVSSPDLNGDGRRDWIVDGEYAYCIKDEQFVAPRPLTEIFVTTPDGVANAYTAEALNYDIDIGFSPARVIRLPDAEACIPGRGKCPEAPLRWNAATGRLDAEPAA